MARSAWFWPALVTFCAGMIEITRPELWRDELASWSAASRGLGDLWRLLGNLDGGYALYYHLLHGWIDIFGDSTLSLRLPSLMAMSGAAACTALVGARLFNWRAGLLAGFAFALIPAISRFAQEARPYAFAVLLASLSTLMLLRAIERPLWSRLAGYAASIALLGLTQIAALSIITAHAVAVAVWIRSGQAKVAWAWLASAAAGVLVTVPMLLLIRSQYARQVGTYPKATYAALALLPARLFLSTGVAIGVIALAGLAWGVRWRSASVLTAWAILPVATLWFMSQLGDSVWMTRYLIVTLPAWAILVGAALSATKTYAAAVVLVVLVLLGLPDQRAIRTGGAHDSWDYPDSVWTLPLQYSKVADMLAQRGRPGDGIVYGNRRGYWLVEIGMAYHLSPPQRPRDVFADKTPAQRGDFRSSECPTLSECLHDEPRIWLLGFGSDPLNPYYGTESEKTLILRANYDVADVREAGGLRVTLLVRRTA